MHMWQNDTTMQAMKVACRAFEGEHDFSNFCKMDAVNVHNYERTIINFEILPLNEMCAPCFPKSILLLDNVFSIC